MPAKGTLALLRRRRALPRRSGCPTRSRKYRSAAYRHALSSAARQRARSIAVVCDFLVAGREPAGAAALPVDSLHAQRRSGDLAAARGERDATRCTRAPARAAVAADAPLRAGRAARASIWCSPCPTPTGDTFARLYPGALAAGRTSCRRAWTPPTSLRPPARRRREPRAPRVHRLDGLAAERRRDALLRAAKSCRGFAPSEPGVTLSIVGRAPTPAVQAPGGSCRHRGHRPRRRCAAAHGGRQRSTSCRCGSAAARGLKIFEAMAMGKAVVSTTVGAEGLPVTTGETSLIADEPAAFAQRGRSTDPRRRVARAGIEPRPGARRRALRLVGGRRRLRRCARSPARGRHGSASSSRAPCGARASQHGEHRQQ